MKFTFITIGILLLIFSSAFCQSDDMRDETNKKEKKLEKNNLPPLILILEYKNNQLVCFLKNNTKKEVLYFYDSRIQPSELIIENEKGEIQNKFDVRTIMKYDNTPYNYLVNPIKPEEKKAITSCNFAKDGKNIQIHWGPYDFKNIPKGKYKVYAQWHPKIKTFFDSMKKLNVEIGVFLSELPLKSNEITIEF